MNQAVKIQEVLFTEGISLIEVSTSDGEKWYRAYDAARAFGFANAESCVRRYAKETKLIFVSTVSGLQPVKCMSLADVWRIAIRSSHPEAEKAVEGLVLSASLIESLSVENSNLIKEHKLILRDIKDLCGMLSTMISRFE